MTRRTLFALILGLAVTPGDALARERRRYHEWMNGPFRWLIWDATAGQWRARRYGLIPSFENWLKYRPGPTPSDFPVFPSGVKDAASALAWIHRGEA
jgi:hypothetical protein